MLVDVRHEDAADLRLREGIRLINAGAAMRRSMAVIGDGLDVAVNVRVEVLPALPHVDAAGNHVEEVWNDAGADEQLAFGVVVDPPRIAETVSDDLEDVAGRVIAPHPAVDLDPVAGHHVRKRLLRLVDAALAF